MNLECAEWHRIDTQDTTMATITMTAMKAMIAMTNEILIFINDFDLY